MQQANHPDDERLAALAASEADAVADASLVSHVSGCSRCAPMVEDLRALHSALAELPDIQPSRPLRFLPAVREPSPRGSRWLGFLRGVTGPAMAIAILFILVGSFGTAFSSGIGLGSAGAAPAAASAANVDARSAGGASPPATSESGKGQVSQPASSASSAPVAAGRTGSASATASASPTGNDRLGNFSAYGARGGTGETEQIRPPFGLMLGFGVVLLAAAFVARGYVRRRSLS